MNVQVDPRTVLDKESGPSDEKDLQARLQQLLDLDISSALSPDHRLLLAVLRQAVLDYFGEDPLEQLDAALYFAHSPIYRLTLQLFDLPEDLLPTGIDLCDFRRRERMNGNNKVDPPRLETLVRDLSGTQLKIVLTMGLVVLPATTRTISLKCGLTRSTVLAALEQLAAQGLVERDGELRPVWSLPAAVRAVVDEVWGVEGR
jgi:hypothetical protein